MDRFYNSKRQSTASYIDIFKACRLCGSGGGYKMPIIQNINDDDNVVEVEAELKQKIKECVSILVQSDDRMPPLICELCVDKVNDFFEFREMCKSTNTRVRALLGLPPQNITQETSEDCILGVSGPVFNSAQNEVESILSSKRSSKSKKDIFKEKPSGKKSASPTLASLIGDRKTRSTPASQIPPADTRNTRKRKVDPPVSAPKKIRFSAPAAPPRSASPDIYLVRKNRRGSAPSIKQSKAPKEKDTTAGLAATKKASASSPYPCNICYAGFTKPQTLRQHQIATHTVSVIEPRLGCSSCRETFSTSKEAESHHRWHRTSNTFYNCDRCSADFRAVQGYTSHFTLKQCIPERIVPDVVCSQCLKKFATKPWMDQHKCRGPPPKGGDCPKCLKHFTGQSQLRRHGKICKGTLLEVNPSNPHLKELRPISIRVDKCDQLLSRIKRESSAPESEHREAVYDLSAMNVIVKTEPEDRGYENPLACNMIIKQEIKEEPPDYGYEDTGFGDNYSSESDAEMETAPRPNLVLNPFARKNRTQVDSLSIISLRSIFSDKMVKKKSKKKRIIKLEPTDASYDAFNALFEMQHTGANTTDKQTTGGTDEAIGNNADNIRENDTQSVTTNNSDVNAIEGPNQDTEGNSQINQEIANSGDDITGLNERNVDVNQPEDTRQSICREDDSVADCNESDVPKESGDVEMDGDKILDEPLVNSEVKENEMDPSVEDLMINDAVATLASKEKARIDEEDDELDFDPFTSLQGDLPPSVLKNRGAFKMANTFVNSGRQQKNVIDESENVKSGADEILDGDASAQSLSGSVSTDENTQLTLETDPNDDISHILNVDSSQLNSEIDRNDNMHLIMDGKESHGSEGNLIQSVDDIKVLHGDAETSCLISNVEQNDIDKPALNETNEQLPSDICENHKTTHILNTDDIAQHTDEIAQVLNQDDAQLTSDNDEVKHASNTDNTLKQNNEIEKEDLASEINENDESTQHSSDTTSEIISSIKDKESNSKAEEACKKDTDSDILDLVSDSGDDCNILEDTLDKNALEEQLLLDDSQEVDTDTQNTINEDELLSEETDVNLEKRNNLPDSDEAVLLLHSDKTVLDKTMNTNSESTSVIMSTSVIVDNKLQTDYVGELHQNTEEIGSGGDSCLPDGKRFKSKGECKAMASEKMDLDMVSDDDFTMDM